MEQDNNIEVTNSELARMIKKGFDHVDERLNEMATKAELKELQRDVIDISHKVNQIDKRLFSLEEDIYETKRKQIEGLDSRVTFVERKLGIENAR